MTRVLTPVRAAWTAVAAAVVVLPTPPLPVKRMTRIATGCLRRRAASTLHPLLQRLQRGVDDDLLGLALEHPEHGDLDVDREAVGDGRRVLALGSEGVGTVHGLEHGGLDQAPGDDSRAVPGDVPLVVQR